MSVPSTNAKIELGPQYGKYGAGFAPAALATGYVTFAAQPSVSDTLSIEGITYTFKSSMTTANDVKIGSNLTATLQNLLAAVQGQIAGSGTQYYAGTSALLKTDAAIGSQTLALTSRIPGLGGNSIALAQGGSGVSARFTLSASTLLGGLKGGSAVASVGAVAFVGQPLTTDTLQVGATTYTFKSSATLTNDVQIAGTLQGTIQNFINKITANSADIASVTQVNLGTAVTFAAATAGAAGNSLAIVYTPASTTEINVSGSVLTGGQDAVPFDLTTIPYKQFRATRVTYDLQQIESVFPQETGTLTPTGVYKGGYFMQGAAELLPRLASDFGWLLLLAVGQVTTSVSGTVATHTFSFNPTQYELPWASARMFVPGRGSVNPLGIIGYDNLMAGITFNMRPMSPIQATVEWMGRVASLDQNAQFWVDTAPEEFPTVPLTNNGSLTINGINSIPIVDATVQFMNDLSGMREEAIIGSPTMDDLVTLRRSLMLQFTLKWNSAEIYNRVVAGAKSGTNWSPSPFTVQTSGGNAAFDLYVAAPTTIPGSTTQYGLHIKGNNIAVMEAGPLTMQPGQVITQKYMAQILNPLSGGAYMEFDLINGNIAGYPMPTEP